MRWRKPGGALLDALGEHVFEPAEFDRARQTLLQGVAFESAGPGDEAEELIDAHFLVERGVAR